MRRRRKKKKKKKGKKKEKRMARERKHSIFVFEGFYYCCCLPTVPARTQRRITDCSLDAPLFSLARVTPPSTHTAAEDKHQAPGALKCSLPTGTPHPNTTVCNLNAFFFILGAA